MGSKIDQEGVLVANLHRPIVFRKGLKKILPFHTVILTFDTPFIGEAILCDGNDCEIKRKQIDETGSTWEVSLTKGIFQVKPAEESAIKFKNNGYFIVIGGCHVSL